MFVFNISAAYPGHFSLQGTTLFGFSSGNLFLFFINFLKFF